jgi:hypothetical protein
MELAKFEADLRATIERFSDVRNIVVSKRTPVSLKASIILEREFSIAVFYNSSFAIRSFSLIYQNRRVFGIDCDNRIGWHIHPVDNADSHVLTEEKSFSEIMELMVRIYREKSD